ncbi:hypothetical protein CYR55_22900 [Chimaeribacter californicus]|uniref:Uncharacterized protein n=2 Tax=Chimaeribacter californicus TaxID=2060067 RepID=A0A2N5DSS1_9GAMM|nr:hypothetical protein CYR55_22900 [Chimaeribacter californicus]
MFDDLLQEDGTEADLYYKCFECGTQITDAGIETPAHVTIPVNIIKHIDSLSLNRLVDITLEDGHASREEQETMAHIVFWLKQSLEQKA